MLFPSTYIVFSEVFLIFTETPGSLEQIYVDNIVKALCAKDATNCPYYTQNATKYKSEITQLDTKYSQIFKAISEPQLLSDKGYEVKQGKYLAVLFPIHKTHTVKYNV